MISRKNIIGFNGKIKKFISSLQKKKSCLHLHLNFTNVNRMSKSGNVEYFREKERWARKKKNNFRPFVDELYHYYEGLEEGYRDERVRLEYDF